MTIWLCLSLQSRWSAPDDYDLSWANDHANYGDPEDQCDNKDSDHHSVSLWLGL